MLNSITKLVLSVIIITFTSCGYIAREMITPKSCKKCEILDQNNNLVWSENNCGGGVYNMEQRAKAKAYDLGCGHRVSCENYKEEDQAETNP